MTTQTPGQQAPEFITRDECGELARVLNRKYASQIKDRHFEVEVAKDGYGVYATITLRNDNGSYFYPVEGRLSHRDHEMSLRDGGLMLLDYIDSYFAEYFREGDVYLPIDWAEYECDGVPFQLKGQILNLEVERMADEWIEAAERDEDQLH